MLSCFFRSPDTQKTGNSQIHVVQKSLNLLMSNFEILGTNFGIYNGQE